MERKKNILIISPFFFPEPISTGKFNADLAIELRNKGHQVSVLCYHPFYPEWKIQKSKKILDGIEIIRGGKYIFFTKKTIIRRFILEFTFALYVLRKIKKCQKNKDIIIPVFPPSLAFLIILPFLSKKIRKVGMIHDLQEIYSRTKKGLLNKLVSRFIHLTEKKCYQNCNKLIFLSKEMKSEAKSLYSLSENKLEVQYPFVTLKNQLTNDLNNLFDKKNKHVVYSGALGEKQNPDTLYNFFEKASLIIKDVCFHFFSKGEEFDKLKNNNSNPKILFHSLVKKENLKELYHKSDVQIIPQKAGTSKGSLPSKLPNLLASNCKIFLITDKGSELELFFNNNKLSYVSTNWHLENLVQKLRSILGEEDNFDKQKEIAKKTFTIDEMVKKVLL